MEYSDVFEAASCLGKEDDLIKLNQLRQTFENKKFFLTVWGQYSSGKSKLINNILERDVLPVQTRETTTVSTYLIYSIQEECILFYENGKTVSHDLTVLKTVFQNSCSDNLLDGLEYIEVYLNNELLRTGMILTDTPGANTVIEKHIMYAAEAVEQSGRILYVLGTSPSDVDRTLIKNIASCGINISFIRTKCDKFISGEENVEESLSREKERVFSYYGKETDFIPVSNESNSRWFKNIEKVRLLLKKISGEIEDELDQAFVERLDVYANRYQKELLEEKERLQEILNGKDNEISQRISDCEMKHRELERKFQNLKEEVGEKIVRAGRESERDLDNLITKRTELFEKALNQIDGKRDIEEKTRIIYADHVNESIEKMQKILNFYFDRIVQEEADNIFGSIRRDISDFLVPTYSEIRQDNTKFMEMYRRRLETVRNNIEKIRDLEKENRGYLVRMEEEYNDADYQETIRMLDDQLAQIPSEPAMRLNDTQKIQPSDVMKMIGNAADIALLMLPGEVIVNIIKKAADTTKLAQVLHKAGKMGKVIQSSGKIISKNANRIDGVKDVVYMLNGVLGERKYSTQAEKQRAGEIINTVAVKSGRAYEKIRREKKRGNVLDALSVAYWTEKFGKKFDKPPALVIDKEEEEKKWALKKQITALKDQQMHERLRRKRELGLLKNREEELRIQKKEEEFKEKQIKEEMQRMESKLREEAVKAAIDRYIRSYVECYRDVLVKISASMSEQYLSTANQNIIMYVAGKYSKLTESITSEKNRMEELRKLKGKDDTTLKSKLAKCEMLLSRC